MLVLFTIQQINIIYWLEFNHFNPFFYLKSITDRDQIIYSFMIILKHTKINISIELYFSSLRIILFEKKSHFNYNVYKTCDLMNTFKKKRSFSIY